MSIRIRLTCWYAVVLLFGLVLFGVVLSVALEKRLVSAIDERLAQRLRGVATAFGPQAEISDRAKLVDELMEYAAEMPDGIIQLRGAGEEVLKPSESQPTFLRTDAGAQPVTVTQEGRRYRMKTASLTLLQEDYEATVSQSLDETESVLRDFRAMLFLLIPAVLLVASLGGYWLSLRALRPVDAITKVAQSISVNNLEQRIPLPRTNDELGRMTSAWNDVLSRLEESVKRMRQFTGDASHELRTPLAVIRATAELAGRRERTTEEYRQAMASIGQVAGEMTVLTEDLLTLARNDEGRLYLPLAAMDLSQVVSAVVAQCEVAALEKGVALEGRVSDSILINGNATSLRRLLLILVDNAVRHTPAGGWVRIGVTAGSDGASLSVADNGEGIGGTALPHIFERFYSGSVSRSEASSHGLGLSIAQAIAQAHGSAIEVTSAPGAGSKFSCLLKKLSSSENLHLY